MNLKYTLAMLALVCATGAAASAGAATLGTGDIASPRHVPIPEAAADRPRLWQASHWRRERRARRHGRRHRRRSQVGIGFGFGFPFSAFAQRRHYDPPPVYYAPPAPAWRFDGTRWVCDYVDYYGRPVCR